MDGRIMKTIFLILLLPALLFSQGITDKHKSVIARMNAGGLTVDTIATTFNIDKDFELAEIIANPYFTSSTTQWAPANAVNFWYNTDWNAVSPPDIPCLLDSATGITEARTYTNATAVVSGSRYAFTYDYYIPSGNTTTKQITLFPSYDLSLQGTLDAWTTYAVKFVSAATGQIRFYHTDISDGNTSTVGDKFYIDNVSLTAFPTFTATGNHSFDSISTAPITGTYSGIITASDAGDGTTNYATLLTANYTTLTNGNDAYISFNALANTTGVNVTMVIGGQSNTWTGVDNVTEELLTWEFSVTASEVGEDILIYLNKAANIKIDDFGN